MNIDFHAHVFPQAFRTDRSRYFSREPAFETLYKSPKSRLVGVGGLLQHMDESHVARSVIFGFPWRDLELVRRHNDYVLNAVHKYPDRLSGLCCFSPLVPKAAEEAERCLKTGLVGIGELAVYDDGLTAAVAEILKGVMAVAFSYGAFVLIHCNEPVGHSYPGKSPMTLGQIEHFLKRYPKNRIVLAHWGGGLPFYALMKKGVKEVLENVWFDTAASPYLYDAQIYRVVGKCVGFDKILFGSDYPLLSPLRYMQEMENAGLSPLEMDQILGKNAAALLHLE